jgi:hypothetical protein
MISKSTAKVGAKLGGFLSNLTYVMSTLLIYLVISILTCIWLLFQLAPQYSKAAFIAYEMATGGDPYNFASELQQYFILWIWVLIFHVISWLIVPVLAATAVDAAFRTYDMRRQELDENLLARMEDIIIKYGGIPAETAEKLAIEAQEKLEREVRERRK